MQGNSYWGRPISRGRFLKGAGLGAVGVVGSGLLAACATERQGGDSSQGKAQVPTAFKDAGVDWRAHEGEEVSLLLTEHWWTDAVKKRLPEFEELTGMSVKTNILSEDSYFQQALVALSSGSSTYDGLMVGNLQVGQYIEADWLEPLDGYFAQGDFIDPAWYEVEDMFEPARSAGSSGGGLLALPISAEAGVVMYRADLFEKEGISPVSTLDELVDAAEALNSEEISGIVGRGRRGLDVVWTWTNYFTTLGGQFFENGEPAVDSPAGIQATEIYIERLLRNYGAKGTSNMSWLEASGVFNEGKAAMYTDASGLISVVLDKEANAHADDVRIARWPESSSSPARPNYWYWLVGIPRTTEKKDAAALFFAWATSKPTATAIARDAGTPSSRESVWQDEQFLDFYPHGMAEEIVANLNAVEPELVPYSRPTFPKEADALSVELVNVLTGDKSPEQAMKDATPAMARAAD